MKIFFTTICCKKRNDLFVKYFHSKMKVDVWRIHKKEQLYILLKKRQLY